MRKIILGIFILTSVMVIGQQRKVIKTNEDLIFDTDQEEFLLENTFDGILNHDVHRQVTMNEKLNFSQTWDTETCFSSRKRNSFSQMNDTLWLCVGDTATKEFKIPFDGYVTSRFGPRHGRPHQGIDISLKTGDMIYAAWGGKVRYAKFNKGGYGNLVVIRHYNGLETFYAHLSKLLVIPNQEVRAGEPIGLGGNTGHSFGAHLHFEVRFYDIPINPDHIIDFANKNVRDENLLVHKDIFKVNYPGINPSRIRDNNMDNQEEEDEHDHDLTIESGEMLAGVALPVANSLEKTTKTPAREFRKYHRVKSGDSLSKIAKQNNTTIEKICQLNGIRPNKTIDVGESIRVK